MLKSLVDDIVEKEKSLIEESLISILNKTKNNKKKIKISIISAFTNQLIDHVAIKNLTKLNQKIMKQLVWLKVFLKMRSKYIMIMKKP